MRVRVLAARAQRGGMAMLVLLAAGVLLMVVQPQVQSGSAGA